MKDRRQEYNERREESQREKVSDGEGEISSGDEEYWDAEDDNMEDKSFLERWAENQHSPHDWETMWL